MKIFIICSKAFYDRIPPIKEALEAAGHEIFLPNCYDAPDTEESYRQKGETEHGQWKGKMLLHSTEVIEEVDAVLVLNFEKHGVPNYIGGATFIEMYDAFRLGKRIFLYCDYPDGILHDEVVGFQPILIDGDLSKIS